MLSALIFSEHSYPALPLTRQPEHHRFVIFGPLVLENEPLKLQSPTADRGPNCLTTFWTQLAYHFNRRTAEPLGPSPAPGCDEPTSRCQTAPSLWTLGRDQPVIPSVPFVLWAMAIPRSTTGSLEPAFASARLVGLTVKLSYTHVLNSPITDRAEKTFVILRYHLGGFRPRKTDLLSMSFSSIRARS
jgi:hypothetical protein